MDNEITLHWAAEFAQSVLAELMDHTDMAPSMRTQAAHAVDHLETALATKPQAEQEPISRAEWLSQAKAFYLEAGDDPAAAAECARYICNQQDWAGGDEVEDPRAAAQEDIRGRTQISPQAEQEAAAKGGV